MTNLPLPYLGDDWSQWSPERRNTRLHTDILRKPYYCRGTFTQIEYPRKPGEKHPVDVLHIVPFECRLCRYRIALSFHEYQENSTKHLPDTHAQLTPPYSQNQTWIWKLIEELALRGEKGALIQEFLTILGVTYQELMSMGQSPLVLFLVDTPETLAAKIWQAHLNVREKDSEGCGEIQKNILNYRLYRYTDEDDVPLFTRIGAPPNGEFVPADFPFALYPPLPDGMPFFTAPVILRERDLLEHFYRPVPDQVVTMQKNLARYFPKVCEPNRFDWAGRWYWSVAFEVI